MRINSPGLGTAGSYTDDIMRASNDARKQGATSNDDLERVIQGEIELVESGGKAK